MKKKFIIKLFIAGAVCLLIFGLIQKSKVEKMKEENKSLLFEKQKLEQENQQLKENLEQLKVKENVQDKSF